MGVCQAQEYWLVHMCLHSSLAVDLQVPTPYQSLIQLPLGRSVACFIIMKLTVKVCYPLEDPHRVWQATSAKLIVRIEESVTTQQVSVNVLMIFMAAILPDG